ncbi:MAG: hypothetical protein K2M37_02465 [Muribaculaceae bacterium]|nr:hypothetical protein [Muribaculaceae bacterium]
MMKFLVILLSFVCPIVAFGESVFENGTLWKEIRYGTPDGILIVHRYDVFMQEVPGQNRLGFYGHYIEDPNLEFLAYVKTEDNRVYVSEDGTQDWLLIYDFNLQPGEGTTIYHYPYGGSGSRVITTYVECKEIVDSPDYPGLKIMKLEEFESESDRSYPRYGEWLIGIGSADGVLHNGRFQMDGGGSRLVEVLVDGKQVYKNEPTGLKESYEGDGDYFEIKGDKLVIKDPIGSLEWGLYSVDGLIIANGVANGQKCEIDLPSGRSVILKIGSRSYVIVK